MIPAVNFFDSLLTKDTADETAIVAAVLSGGDLFTVSPAPDEANGLGGNDTMYGFGASDTLAGGTGDDLFFGGADYDALNGDFGKDTIYGGSGGNYLQGDLETNLPGHADLLFGDAGNDLLTGGRGNDTLSGGRGRLRHCRVSWCRSMRSRMRVLR